VGKTLKKNKPLMGTQLVPSIENVEGCYQYGGVWDKKNKICLDEDPKKRAKAGCTAPIKGVRICWCAPGFPDYGIDRETGEEVAIDGYRPIVTIETTVNQGGDPDILDTLDESEWFDPPVHTDETSALLEAEYDAIRIAKTITTGENWRLRTDWNLSCFTPRGKQIGCDQPNAVVAYNGKQVADAYSQFFKEKPLKPFPDKDTAYKYRDYIELMQTKKRRHEFFGKQHPRKTIKPKLEKKWR
jgi:hypothetical protein